MAEITEGIINLNKPAEWTSHDCVAVLRGILGIKRIGHTGTLDPMAVGVLPICIGPATRIMEYLDLDFKTYACELKLGLHTDTLDIWGEILSEQDASHVMRQDIEQAFAAFQGHISQIPPNYSAIKVKGKKLYQYARAGEEVEIKPRQVFIKELRVDTIDLQNRTVGFTVTCSKGTYIRSICRDVGEILGCGAVMSGLSRTASGIFSIEDAVGIEDLKKMSTVDIRQVIRKTDEPLIHFGKAVVSAQRGRYFCNGGRLSADDAEIEREPAYKQKEAHLSIREEYKRAYNLYMKEGQEEIFLGVAFYNGEFVADKVFYRG